MNNKSSKMTQDDRLKDLLSGSKIKASENLKYRIMHQIETEKCLSREQKSKERPILGSMFSIFGIMYALIALIGFGIYHTLGSEALLSTTFYLPVIFISFVCGLFWLITVLDERRKAKE